MVGHGASWSPSQLHSKILCPNQSLVLQPYLHTFLEELTAPNKKWINMLKIKEPFLSDPRIKNHTASTCVLAIIRITVIKWKQLIKNQITTFLYSDPTSIFSPKSSNFSSHPETKKLSGEKKRASVSSIDPFFSNTWSASWQR